MSWSHTSASPTFNNALDQTQASPQGSLTMDNPAQTSPRLSSYNDPFARQSPHIRPTLSSNLNAPGSQSQQIGRDDQSQPTTWFQNNFNSINWLPDDWTPDFDNVQNESFTHQQMLMFGSNLRSDLPGIENGESSTTAQLMTRPSIRQTDQTPIPLPRQMESQELSSPGSHSTRSGGRFYVDGDGARLPHVRKAPYRHSDSYTHASRLDCRTSHPTFAFPDADEDDYQDDPAGSLPNTNTIPANVYSEIFRVFSLTCVSSTQYPHFQGNSIPSLYTFSRYVHNYIQHFRTILPFTHPTTFDLSTTHWLLILAMAAIGSHYNDSPGAPDITFALHEFLRRAILTVVN